MRRVFTVTSVVGTAPETTIKGIFALLPDSCTYLVLLMNQFRPYSQYPRVLV